MASLTLSMTLSPEEHPEIKAKAQLSNAATFGHHLLDSFIDDLSITGFPSTFQPIRFFSNQRPPEPMQCLHRDRPVWPRCDPAVTPNGISGRWWMNNTTWKWRDLIWGQCLSGLDDTHELLWFCLTRDSFWEMEVYTFDIFMSNNDSIVSQIKSPEVRKTLEIHFCMKSIHSFNPRIRIC